MKTNLSTSADMELYDSVKQLLEVGRSATDRDRRDGERKGFHYIQLMAPYDGKTLPTQADFYRVECNDISPQGFSFLAFEKPKYHSLIVALGGIPFSFVAAEVRHTEKSADESSSAYLVGCRFTKRLDT